MQTQVTELQKKTCSQNSCNERKIGMQNNRVEPSIMCHVQCFVHQTKQNTTPTHIKQSCLSLVKKTDVEYVGYKFSSVDSKVDG
jgi:hypothetical protein